MRALAYLALKLVLFPATWVSGIAYLLYGFWQQAPNASAWLAWVALIHTAVAFAIAAFVIAHVYLLTPGRGCVNQGQCGALTPIGPPYWGPSTLSAPMQQATSPRGT